MSVYRLKGGRWIVQYRKNKEGKYRREYFGRGLDAEAKARARNEELGLGKYVRRQRKFKDIFFEKLATLYFIAKEGKNESSTLLVLDYKLHKVILPEIGATSIEKITPYRMDQYVSKRLKKVKRSTVHREISDIQAILNWAVARKYIRANPIAGYKKPKRDDRVIQPVTLEECRQLIKHSPPHLKRALILSYYTGLRPGQAELFRIKWSDVTFEQKTIFIHSAKKKGPRFRQIPLHPAFLKILTKWKEEDRKKAIEEIITYRKKPIKTIKTSFRMAKKKAGITRKLPPYAFRHAFVTGLLSQGADLKSVSEMAGHSRTDTTTRIYQHTNLQHQRSAIEKLPSLDLEE